MNLVQCYANANTHFLIHCRWPGIIWALLMSHKARFDLCTSDPVDCRLVEKVGHKCPYGWIGFWILSNARDIKTPLFSEYDCCILLINAHCFRLSSCLHFGHALYAYKWAINLYMYKTYFILIGRGQDDCLFKEILDNTVITNLLS